MLGKYNKSIRIIILVICYLAMLQLELFLFKNSSLTDNLMLNIGFALAQCLLVIFCAFLFFQAFKYVRLPSKYYFKKTFESRFYFKYLGVLIYRYILINSFMRYANSRVYLKGKKREYLSVFHEETKQSETSHVSSFTITLFIQFSYLYQGEIILFFSLTLFSIFFNVYPILLQRNNRFETERRFPIINQNRKP
jgi:hypothetical protein